jgi:hypothetical protein
VILSLHALLAAGSILVLLLFEMFYGRDSGSVHDNLSYISALFYLTFNYSVFTIILDLTKVEDFDDLFPEVRKYLVTKTEIGFYEFTRMPLSMQTSIGFLIILGVCVALCFLTDKGEFNDSLTTGVVLIWLVALLLVIEWQIRECIFTRVSPKMEKLFKTLKYQPEEAVNALQQSNAD